MEDTVTMEEAVLGIMVDSVNDIEKVRIAIDNRVRSLAEFSLEGTPLYDSLTALSTAFRSEEEAAIKALEKVMKSHSLGPWIKRTVGVGFKQGARLIGAIGNPLLTGRGDESRSISQLWAYGGYSVVDGEAPRRRKGVRSNWNPEVRMRAHLIAESCIKARTSPYRKAYDAAREKYADAVHPAPCPRCGPKGKPALAGSPLSAGHQHARALRIVAKEVLRDIWLEAQRTETSGSTTRATNTKTRPSSRSTSKEAA